MIKRLKNLVIDNLMKEKKNRINIGLDSLTPKNKKDNLRNLPDQANG